jgi:uncharacterized protein YerC
MEKKVKKSRQYDDKVVSMLRQGTPPIIIEQQVGCPLTKVYKIAQLYNLNIKELRKQVHLSPFGRNVTAKHQKQLRYVVEVVTLYNAGYNYSQISKYQKTTSERTRQRALIYKELFPERKTTNNDQALNNAKVEKLIALGEYVYKWKKYVSINEIAEKLNLFSSYVYNALTSYCTHNGKKKPLTVNKSKARFTRDQILQMIEQHKNGESYKDIAEKNNVSIGLIARYCTESQITEPSQSNRHLLRLPMIENEYQRNRDIVFESIRNYKENNPKTENTQADIRNFLRENEEVIKNETKEAIDRYRYSHCQLQ